RLQPRASKYNCESAAQSVAAPMRPRLRSAWCCNRRKNDAGGVGLTNSAALPNLSKAAANFPRRANFADSEVTMKIGLALTFAILAALCATNSAIARAQTKERAKLIEEAKKDGKVMVYVSSNASDARALEAAFEKKYPFVNMEFYSSGKDALLTRYLLEARTGANLADVYQSSVFPIMNLAEKGLLAKYHSPEREGFIEALRDKDGYWHATYLNAVTMAYNSRMLKPDEVPSSYQELLQPKWKEKMGFVLSHTEWYFAMLQSMGEEKGRQYMEALSRQNIHARI